MMKIRSALALGAFAASLVTLLACGSSDKTNEDYPFPDGGAGTGGSAGQGGWGSGAGGHGAGGSGQAGTSGNAGSGGEAGSGPQCADEYKRCAHEFRYPAGSETSVEIRGSFAEDGWDKGAALSKNGSYWTVSLEIPQNFEVHYKFVVDGTSWVPDPDTSIPQIDDGQGGKNSVYASGTCDNFTCADEAGPWDCADTQRTCDYKFIYPFNGESSVEVRGDFTADGWSHGVPMTHEGSQWVARVPNLTWGNDVQYKFFVNGSQWVSDPHNPNHPSDNDNSLISGLTCDWWSCGQGSATGYDWRDSVLYFVFVDRFKDGNSSNNGSPTGQGVEHVVDFNGGDWAGVREKINSNYFNELGVNTLWISATFNNTSSAGKGQGGDNHMYSAYHGYWPTELDQTEEHFGTMDELKGLVTDAHAKGLKVIVDYVMNHVHKDSSVYQQHRDWFWPGDNCICGQGCSWDDPAQAKRCWFTDYLPDFNFTVQAARDYSVGNAMMWINETGIDGFRLDAVKHIEDSWILDLRRRVSSEVEPTTQQHFYMVGETFTGDRNTIKHYVSPSMLDGQFEFPLRLKLLSTMLIRNEGMQALESELGAYESYYGSQAIMSTFIGNHDVPRSIHFAEDNPISQNVWYDGKERGWSNQPSLPAGGSAYERLSNAFTVIFTIKGIPLIYYGDEVGMAGAGDPDNRRPMQWDNYSSGQQQLLNHIKKLGKIRAEHASLRRGRRTTVSVSNDVYAYKMEASGDTLYVIINRSDNQQQVSGLPSSSTNLLNDTSVSGSTVTVPARSSMILKP